MAETEIKDQTQPANRQGASQTSEPVEEKYIWVVGTAAPKKDGGQPLALYEKDEAHPNGEAFVAGDTAVQVALTSEVSAKLRSGELAKANAEQVAAAKKLAKKLDEAAQA